MYLVSALHVLLVLWLWWYFFYRRVSLQTSSVLLAMLVLKVAVGYFVTVYYQSTYGGGDMIAYLQDAQLLHTLFRQDPVGFFRLIFTGTANSEAVNAVLRNTTAWYDSIYRMGYNDAQTVIRFHALWMLCSGGALVVHLLWSNVCCLLGMWWMMDTLLPKRAATGNLPLFSWVLLLLPNVLLWSSPVMKEPLLLFVLGALVRTLWRYTAAPSVRNGLLLLAAVLCFLLIKNFWLLLLLPGIVTLVFRPVGVQRPGYILSGYAVAACCAVLAGLADPAFHLPSLLYGQQMNTWRFAIFEQAGSLLTPVPFAPVWWSLLRHLPAAFLQALGWPLPTAPLSWMQWTVLGENLLVVVLLVSALFKMIRYRMAPDGLRSLLLIGGAGILVVSALTTPVLGTLIRFKMPGVFLLVLVALAVLRTPAAGVRTRRAE